MLLPRDIGQLTLALPFRPGAVDTVGLRIAIAAAHRPLRDGNPTTFLDATLHDVTPDIRKARFPTYRFVIDETSHGSEAVQRVLASRRENLERSYQTYSDDDPAKEVIRQVMAETPLVCLKFASAEWAVILGDNATLYTTHGDPEPIGDITQLTVLK